MARGNKMDGCIGVLGLAIMGGYLILNTIIAIFEAIFPFIPYLLLGIIIYSSIQWVEEKLVEHNNDWKLFYEKTLKRKLKFAVFLAPLILAFGYYSYTDYLEQKRVTQAKLEAERIEIERKQAIIEAERLALQAKKDSSLHYFEVAEKYFYKKHYKQSLANLDSSLMLFPDNHQAKFTKGLVLKKRRKYKNAIAVFDELIDETNSYDGQSYLEKGRCLLKLHKKKEAILQLHLSAELKNEEAQKLYDKVNPLIKVKTGYLTRCCDGTISYASGRGACSHHGGVCNWNEPIYTNRRKYVLK